VSPHEKRGYLARISERASEPVAGIVDPGWIAYNPMEIRHHRCRYNKSGSLLLLLSSRAERKDLSDGLQHPTSDSHRRQSCSRERFLNWSSIMP